MRDTANRILQLCAFQVHDRKRNISYQGCSGESSFLDPILSNRIRQRRSTSFRINQVNLEFCTQSRHGSHGGKEPLFRNPPNCQIDIRPRREPGSMQKRSKQEYFCCTEIITQQPCRSMNQSLSTFPACVQLCANIPFALSNGICWVICFPFFGSLI